MRKKKAARRKKLRQATGKGLASKEPFGSHGRGRRGRMAGIGGICTNSMKSTRGEKIALHKKKARRKPPSLQVKVFSNCFESPSGRVDSISTGATNVLHENDINYVLE